VRAFKPGEKGRPASATSAVLLKSFEWSIDQGARVLNLSFAGPRDPLMEKAVRAAHARRAILVAAAGNAGPSAPPAYPAAYPQVIAVTATDSADRLYAQANRGAYIAMAAPGVDILAPTAGHAHQLHSGTSFAAAHVSGIIALLLERNPHLSAETARLALTAAASDLGAPGPDEQFGAGRANAYAALRLLEQAAAPSR
jgi:subtilisin family serine protease